MVDLQTYPKAFTGDPSSSNTSTLILKISCPGRKVLGDVTLSKDLK
jgi:hypothetical protein